MDSPIIISWVSPLSFLWVNIRSDFYFFYHFSMKILKANRIAPDGTPRSEASHLGLFCLPMSHKRDARLNLQSDKCEKRGKMSQNDVYCRKSNIVRKPFLCKNKNTDQLCIKWQHSPAFIHLFCLGPQSFYITDSSKMVHVLL